ncbi:MAG TPA: prephenate dehydratase [Candidatus Saccharimonadales bacterium]|nr:prephenate dehydratase [Candidatus Saccharimonadales bacterium]
MEEINDIRKNIDDIDKKILDLLNQRAKWALKIKKTTLGKTPIRPERESSIVRELAQTNPGPLPPEAVREIFTAIIASFRDSMQLEKPVKVSFLGPKGSYSEEAAVKLFGGTITVQPEETIQDVVRSVENGSANLAVVPIENSSEGAVIETHRLLFSTDAKIVAEISLPIIHCLLANTSELERITTVYAHPQALGQCRNWLATHLAGAKQVPCSSNSAAAELAAKEKSAAAVAGRKAGEIYGLKIVESGINDQPGNETRFLALGGLETQPTGHDKTSMIIVLNDNPGALHRVLGILANAGINMTRLESQPYKKDQYAFYIDFVGHIKDEQVAEAVKKIDQDTRICQILGSYPAEVGR